MSLKQSSTDSSRLRSSEGDARSFCWRRGRDQTCLRVEAKFDDIFIFPYQQFLGAHHTTDVESAALIISFSTHEITVAGRHLDEVASALQDLSLEWIKAVPAPYRKLPETDEVWITQIEVKAAK